MERRYNCSKVKRLAISPRTMKTVVAPALTNEADETAKKPEAMPYLVIVIDEIG